MGDLPRFLITFAFIAVAGVAIHQCLRDHCGRVHNAGRHPIGESNVDNSPQRTGRTTFMRSPSSVRTKPTTASEFSNT